MSIAITVARNCREKLSDNMAMEHTEWELLSPEEKKKQLFLNQKQLLDTFLEKHAISKAQYDKSLGDLQDKMGMHGID